jgi:hypothetical protein
MMPPRQLARFAGYGAFAVVVGLALLFGLMAFGTRHTPLGGIDAIQARVTLVSLIVPFAVIIAVHAVYARQLIRWSREE